MSQESRRAELAQARPHGAVIVFARAPLPGQCKSRLAAGIGARRAARIYRQLLQRTVKAAIDSDVGEVQLWLAHAPLHPLFTRLRQAHGLSLHLQRAGSLGQRMARALDCALNAGARYAILCGTDVANLEPSDFRAAAKRLRQGPGLVLQGAGDGGYVLIGASQRSGSLLSRGIQWSSGREGRQTRRQYQRQGVDCQMLRSRLDIDDASDLKRARLAGLVRAF